MFAQPIHVECVSFYEPKQGVWRKEPVEEPTRNPMPRSQEIDEKELEAFCRRSLA